MKELLKKSYEFPIRFMNNKTIVFRFEQAVLKELLEMSTAITSSESLNEWLFTFLSKNNTGNVKITMKLYSDLTVKHINSIVEYLIETYAKGYFEKAKEGDKKIEVKSPSSSFVAFILEHSNETVESLLNMTWEQINYILEGLAWNLREQSKEGQSENRRLWNKMQSEAAINDEDAIKMVREMEKRLSTVKFKSNGKRGV